MSKRYKIYDFEGRRVTLLYRFRVSAILERAIEQGITEVCQKEPVAKQFPGLMFLVEKKEGDQDISHRTVAAVNAFEISEGGRVVHIFGPGLIRATRGKEPAEIQKTLKYALIHELTHLWQISLVPAYVQSAKSVVEMVQAINAKIKAQAVEPSRSQFAILHLRIIFQQFFHAVGLEGLAEYCAQAAQGKVPFTNDLFEELYADANWDVNAFSHYVKRTVKSLLKASPREVDLSVAVLERDLSKAKYSVGGHIVYSLLFLDPSLTVEKILLFSPYQFIRKYEAVMLSKDRQPVVSLTSGRGKIDYKHTLQEWAAIVKSFQG